MQAGPVLLPMTAHLVWLAFLYVALTFVRAPAVWGIGQHSAFAKTCRRLEPRVSANLSNQFEWPLLFYVVCLLLMMQGGEVAPVPVVLAWLFVAGRVVHSGVQIFTHNVRLRGLVFMVNFVAVLGLWGCVLSQAFSA